MIALLALFLLQDPPPAKPQPPPADVTCIDIVTFDIQNSDTQRSVIVDGSLLNRTPWELTAVAVDITIIGDNKFPLGNLQGQRIGTVAPRKGAAFSLRGLTLPLATRFTHRMTIRYTIEGTERAQVYENLLMKQTKIYVDPEAGPKVGVMGYYVIPGGYKTVNKQQVYTGDTVFIRIRMDGFDDKTKPEGQLEVTMAGDGKKQPRVSRSITTASQKVDVSKLPGNDADPKLIFYDGVHKDLHVGLQRVENMTKLGKISFEVRFSGKGGTWTWTNLEEPCLEALRPPDKK
jgi:hypothetical protein